MVIRRRLMMMMMVQGSQEVANGDFCVVRTDAWHAQLMMMMVMMRCCIASLLHRITDGRCIVISGRWW
jgi:hypothetical protein